MPFVGKGSEGHIFPPGSKKSSIYFSILISPRSTINSELFGSIDPYKKPA
jgi:hypothetical protein